MADGSLKRQRSDGESSKSEQEHRNRKVLLEANDSADNDEDGAVEAKRGKRETLNKVVLAKANDWGLDPLFWCHVVLMIAQIHALKRDAHTRCDHILADLHPISRAEILGIIVRIDVREHVVKYAVDDGTGVIDCVDWRKNTAAMSTLRISVQTSMSHLRPMLGSRVRVLGKLRLDTFVNDLDGDLSTGASTKASPFPNKNKNIINTKASDHGVWTRELIVTTMECISDPNAELLHFARAKSLTESMYSRPCDASFLSSWKQHFSRSSQGPEGGSQGDTSVSEIAERTETVLGDLLIHFVQERERASQAKTGAGKTLADESFYTLRDFVEADSVWREAQRRTGFRPEETRKFLNGALERLLKSGKLYHVKDLYGLVSEDFLVIPAILLVLDRFDREEGVSMYDLIKTLHEDERLRFVAQEVVESALSRLQGTGDVYEPKRRRFRLVSPAESEK